jgi:hypothetical protein
MSFAEFNHSAGPLFATTAVTAEGTASGASDAADDEDVQFGLPLEQPSDIAVFDVAIHKDVVLASAPRVGLYFTRLPKDASGMIPINSPVRCAAHLRELDRLDLPAALDRACAIRHDGGRRVDRDGDDLWFFTFHSAGAGELRERR